MSKEQLKVCLESINEFVRGQKRLERKNKILAQSNKLKNIQVQKNSTKIQEENIIPKAKKLVKKIEKENIKRTQPENQHQIQKTIKQKSQVQQFLEQIHLKILPFSKICDQIENFYKFKNKITEESAIHSNQTCIYKHICKQKSTRIQNQKNNYTPISISPISTKQTVSIINNQNKKTPLEFFSFNNKYKKLTLFQEDIKEICELANGIRILNINKQ
ncbi:unnamed protein product [Paramecium sonneborni]|uniref:Uncharacterized protein n=1 Tax=Paramecium sonneborni TaxID=65129 RepID=A0A8S1KVG1_9CILI|nr:unnamed protein product [Paramecium sonneborni]CAD8057313.1 unnamed protein product [Paramecium sonneborni]